ncbi:MAG: tetratricopeptide repeat protein [Bacteroidales bacterium]|nr:tetratricopeptide repeat protein [Bacteroidales bacterium]
MKGLLFSVILFCFIGANALPQSFSSNGNEKDKFKELVKQGNACFDSYQFTKAEEFYMQALAINPDDRFVNYKLQDIKTMLELFKLVEKYEQVAEVSGVMPKIIEKKVLDESVSEKKTEAIEKQIEETKSDNTLFVAESKTEVPIDKPISVVMLKTEEKPVSKPVTKTTVDSKESPVSVQPVKKIDEKELEQAYQEEQKRLLAKYKTGKTVEEFPTDSRTITRTIIRNEDSVEIFLRIKYKWGGVFYYKDDSPRDVLPISEEEYRTKTYVE